MKLRVNRCLLAVIVASGLLLGAAVVAVAATGSTTTLPASFLTATTAQLRGQVDTGEQPTYWQFQYGRTMTYGSNTNARLIPAGHGTVSLALRIGGLRRGTRYHFRLVTQYGAGSQAYPINVNFGQDRTFVTRAAGSLGLGSTTLTFSNRSAPVSLFCAGTARCRATLRITRAKAGHPNQKLTLGKRSITDGAGQIHTFQVRLSNTALTLLTNHGNTLGATLTIVPRSGKNKLVRHITLVRTSSSP